MPTLLFVLLYSTIMFGFPVSLAMPSSDCTVDKSMLFLFFPIIKKTIVQFSWKGKHWVFMFMLCFIWGLLWKFHQYWCTMKDWNFGKFASFQSVLLSNANCHSRYLKKYLHIHAFFLVEFFLWVWANLAQLVLILCILSDGWLTGSSISMM